MALTRIGALWRKKSEKDGTTFFSGQFELTHGQPVRIVVMPFQRKGNTPKTSTGEDPAYTILLATEDNKKTANQKQFANAPVSD